MNPLTLEWVVKAEGDYATAGREVRARKNPMKDFAVCCAENREPDASGKSVRHTMAIVEAVLKSAQKHDSVAVSL